MAWPTHDADHVVCSQLLMHDFNLEYNQGMEMEMFGAAYGCTHYEIMSIKMKNGHLSKLHHVWNGRCLRGVACHRVK